MAAALRLLDVEGIVEAVVVFEFLGDFAGVDLHCVLFYIDGLLEQILILLGLVEVEFGDVDSVDRPEVVLASVEPAHFLI